jgi:hypothetical protein
LAERTRSLPVGDLAGALPEVRMSPQTVKRFTENCGCRFRAALLQEGATVRKQPTFGALYGLYGDEDSAAYTNEAGTQLWMYRQGQEIRFFDHGGVQVGPGHGSVVMATVWAFAHGWRNSRGPAWLNAVRPGDALPA